MADKYLFLVVIQILIVEFIGSQYCNEQYEKPLRYKMVKMNAYSKKPVLTRKDVPNLRKCKQFAAEKRALAFNFGRYESSYEDSQDVDDPFNVNCILFMCPETNNFTALVKVEGFNYYSVHHRNDSLGENRTWSCVPGAGLFMISHDKLNYTDARKSCQNLNASLAHVASQIRTDRLAAIIGENTSVYVGLSSDTENKMWRNECNEPLSCFYYRAWGEGEPKSYGCAALTRIYSNSIPFWQVVSCKQQLQYICEIASDYYRGNSTDNNSVMPNCGQQDRVRPWEVFVNIKTVRKPKKKT